MNYKKVLAAIMAITAPIWFIPAAIIFILCFAFMDCYENILELLGEK